MPKPINENSQAVIPLAKEKRFGATERIKIFDAVRAAATIAVFIFHAGYWLHFADPDPFRPFSPDGGINWHHFVFVLGTVGVSVFFVLSGFLLFYQMYKQQEKLTKQGLKEYIKKRLLRILPLYIFSIFFIVLAFRPEILSADGSLKAIIYNLLFIRGIHADGASKITINPVYWSLIIEIHFYVILPIFYAIFYKYQRAGWFFLLALAGLGYRVALTTLLDNPTMQLLRFTPANLDFFAFGMLGAYLFIRYKDRLKNFGHPAVQLGWLGLFLVFIHVYDLDFKPTTAYLFAPTLLGSITAATMLSLMLNQHTKLARVITWQPIMFIAQISFSIYIWHTMIVEKIEPLAMPGTIKFFLAATVTLIFSTITYYLIEAPFLKKKIPKRETVINEGM